MELSRYNQALLDAHGIVQDRDEQGENAVRPIEDSFLHGIIDIFAIIHMKIIRVDGRYANDDKESIREELLDIINYAAFAVAILDSEKETPTHVRWNYSPHP